MKVNTNPKKIEEVLARGVKEVIVKKDLEKKLLSGKKLRIKFGVDPTASHIHLGQAAIFWKLKEFQKLGHKVVFIIGDFTARIGDPAGKLTVRKTLTQKEVEENMKTYKEQVGKILDLKQTEIIYNSKYLSNMGFVELYRIFNLFTVNQILEREIFQKRMEKEKPIWMHEFFYPILQSYDSVKVKADVEIGGTDQLFNMLMGRDLQPHFGQQPQDVITMKLLIGTDGEQKMSQSIGNYIGISEQADQQYGKTMSVPDNLIFHYFELATDIPLEEIARMKKDLKLKKINPKDLKQKLAREIVALYHSKKAVEKAEKEFNRIFKEKKLPSKIPGFRLKTGAYNILDLLVKIKLASSKSEAKRLILQKGVKIDNKVQDDWQKDIKTKKGMLVQAGKRRFIKII